MGANDGDAAGMTPAPAEWHRALQEAAHWYVTLNDASDEAKREAWRQWLRSKPLHAAAWEKVDAVGRRFGGLCEQHDPVSMAAGLRRAASPGRRRSLRALACLLVAGAGAGVGWRYPPAREQLLAWCAGYRTSVGEIRDARLADGSRLWLNTASAADFVIDANWRRLILHQGEVMVRTAHDGERPFIVDTRFGTLRALGTLFLVRRQAEHTHLAVLEGAVEVSLAETGERRVVAQGAQQDFFADRYGDGGVLDVMQTSWRAGMLTVDNIRLADFLGQLSRYRHGYLAAHPDVADLRVVGAYPVPDTDAALALLSEALPVRVHRSLPWWVTVEPL